MRTYLLALSIVIVVAAAPAAAPAQNRFLGNTADAWAKQLKNSKDANQRRSAAFALGKMGRLAFAVLPDLKSTYAQEKDNRVRDTIIFALGDICRDTGSGDEDRDLEPLLLAALRDSDPLVRRSAAYSLGCLAGAKSAYVVTSVDQRGNKKEAYLKDFSLDAIRAALDAALGDENASVRQNAAWALGQVGKVSEKEAIDVLTSLRKALKDADSIVKRDGASSLFPLTKKTDKVHDLVKELCPLCRDTNSEVRRAALNVLVPVINSDDTFAAEPLHAALDDRDLENKRNAALALSSIGGKKAIPALPVLLEAIQNGDPNLRRQAVIAISKIGPAAASTVPELIRLLGEDADEEIRANAALALGAIGTAAEPAIPLLMKKIQDTQENRKTRTECAMALKGIGPVPGAFPIIPTLLEILGTAEQDPVVRERIVWALRIHAEKLRTMDDSKAIFDTFAKVLKESPKLENKMLRYDCAYMLGMIWQQQAPDAALDVLTEFLKDNTILLYVGRQSILQSQDSEIGSGVASVKESGLGDGRVMAVDALKYIGSRRYGKRADIMKQLRFLRDNDATYPELRKKAAELTKGVR